MSRNAEYQFVPTDVGTIEDDMTARLEELTGQKVRQGSPEGQMLHWMAQIISQERVMTNYAANQNIPSRAEGENLDALGELFFGETRPEATASVCTVRFFISEIQEFSVTVPAGTRVTDEGNSLTWESVEDLVIQPGSTHVDGKARCQTAGTAGNGYVPGQIDTVVDLYDYCSGAWNLTETEGGTDRASDEDYYQILQGSMTGHSAAGTRGAYAYAAKQVSTEIGDVVVTSPEACQVVIYVLMQDGKPAGEEMKAAVLAVCGDEKTRVLTDLVKVEDPETVEYDVEVTYYLEEGTGKSKEEMDRAVAQAAAEYTAWQAGKLGRDINPSRLMWLLGSTGVKRAEVTAPVFRKLENGRDGGVPQVAALGNVKLVNGGYERE